MKRVTRTLHEAQHTFMISRWIFLTIRNISDKAEDKIKTHIFMTSNFFTWKLPFMGSCGKILWSQRGHRWQYGACALHAGYLRLQTHAQNTQ